MKETDKLTQESLDEALHLLPRGTSHHVVVAVARRLDELKAERDLERKMLEQEGILRDELVEALRKALDIADDALHAYITPEEREIMGAETEPLRALLARYTQGEETV